ncbi:1-deoxy-D-xylulose-5-phosphate reductoisomerase [Marinicella sp. S1101]|uniref:1-deoxy-D-xylulose-5-phosphate reductoisomerase n=1 Tax=Marinicella marina TaxID=2996016 RepID=UPI002260A66B|nr:1-deoxy-D-xylulose-5-phosphate reductoisomerase [Marinicella marina]MCX7554810.1 1-deoxy-D-xylulose-5-phosphate reductoisomerase [Marinicella marina]MDJ1140957.1 1-deoxy-D-xylulose-5-phosphate reductoisomerase [Marinicella marina]
MKTVAITGATGSIGDSSLAIIRKHPDQFKVHALSGHQNSEKLIRLAAEFKPKNVVISDKAAYQTVKKALSNSTTQVHAGAGALDAMVADKEVDLVVAAIVGNAGMDSVLAAVKAGKTLLLANKESIVAAGPLVMQLAQQTGAKIVPLDSEHNAIYQCLGSDYLIGTRPEHVRNITLTASGGPFWNTPEMDFVDITPAQAVAHPKWDMGAKISVDSATLMNKGLEIIEAHWLFNMPNQDIQVVVHPQSIIHSMVNYEDGSVLAQMGCPDMQIPISHGLGLGQRLSNDADFLDLVSQGELNFYQADMRKFQCLQLARDAMVAGGTAPAVLNAANEVSVAAFLAGQIRFDQIGHYNAKILDIIDVVSVESLAHLKALDAEVRQQTTALIQSNR